MNDKTKPNNNSFLIQIRNNWLFVLIWIALSCFIFCGVLKYFFDYDIYHMLSAGRGIADYGILKEDIFFLDSGHKIVIQQWLYNLIVYAIFELFGKPGIFLTTLLLTALFVFFAVRLLRLYEIDIRIAVTAVLLICIIVIEAFSIRPGLLTMILLLIQLCICEKHIKTGKWTYLLFLPLITFLEINLHATMWIAHFIFLLPYLVPIPSIINKFLKISDNHISIKKIALPLTGMVLSLFINPYRIKGITILFDCKDINILGINELQSPVLSSKYAVVLIVVLLMFAFLYGKTKIHSNNAFMVMGTAIMLMLNLRNIQMFSIGIIAIMCDLLRIVPMEKIGNIIRNTKKVIVLFCSVLFCSVICIFIMNTSYLNYLYDNPSDNYCAPVLAVNYLNEHASHDSRIYTEFSGGSYVSWCGYKIYFCSRCEGYCKEVNGGYDLINEMYSIYKNEESNPAETYESFLAKYDFDYLIVNNRNRMFTYLLSHEKYEPVVYGNGYVVFKAL